MSRLANLGNIAVNIIILDLYLILSAAKLANNILLRIALVKTCFCS
jgi:hypothetical protein